MPVLQMGEHDEATCGRSKFAFFHPKNTLKCQGDRTFRSQAVRDLACLLDLEPRVVWWRCAPAPLEIGGGRYFCDLLVGNRDGTETLLDSYDKSAEFDFIERQRAASETGRAYRVSERSEICGGARLQNAKDLLRYANYNIPLGDRMRMLAALEEEGPLRVADCLRLFHDRDGMAVVAWLMLRERVEIEIDDAPIGLETTVRRIPSD